MIRALCIVLGGSLFLAALFTGPVYRFIQSSDAEYIQIFARYPFSRVFDRVWMLAAAILLGLQHRAFCFGPVFDSVRREGRRFWPRLLVGVIWATGSGLLALWVLVLIGALNPGGALSFEKLSFKILGLIPAALLISLIEEIFFRGLLLRSLTAACGVRLAILSSSLLYAAVHFVQPQKGFAVADPGWLSGFAYLGVLGSSVAAPQMACAFVGLLFVGLALATIVTRTGRLSVSIGLHAGWVIVIKLAVWLTTLPPGTLIPHRFFLVSHPIGWGIVAITPLVLALLWRSYAPLQADYDRSP